MTPKQIYLRIKARNLTIKALAGQIGVCPQTLSKWLNTGRIPPWGQSAISKALNFEGDKDAEVCIE